MIAWRGRIVRLAVGLALASQAVAPASAAAQDTSSKKLSRGALNAAALVRPRVPDVMHQSFDTARAWLGRAGYRPGHPVVAASSEPRATVIDQDPKAGAVVDRGSVVTLTLSSGTPPDDGQTRVPPLSGLTPQQVSGALERARLKLGASDSIQVLDQSQVRLVARQRPDSGTVVGRLSPVDVWYGVLAQAIPDLSKQTQDAAGQLLAQQGFVLGDVGLTVDKDGNGLVFDQNPPAGQRAFAGTPVSIRITVPPKRTKVPLLKGLPEEEAVALLQKLGLTAAPVVHTPTEGGTGLVMAQSPDPGTPIELGSPVSIEIAEALPPPARVAVPHLVGHPDSEAVAQLAGAKLQLGAINSLESKAVPGLVVRQDPLPDQLVDTGTAVAIWLSKPPDSVTVPDVVGFRAGAGEAAIHDLHLSTASEDSAAGSSDDGLVIRQEPAGKSRAAPNAVVRLWIGRHQPTPWWWYALGAAAVAGLAVLASHFIPPASPPPGPSQPDPPKGPPVVRLVPVPDPSARVVSDRGSPLIAGPEIVLTAEAGSESMQVRVEGEPFKEED